MMLHAKVTAAAVVAAGLMWSGAASAQGYYEGKIVTMIVPHSASGGFAKYSQLFAPVLKEKLKAADVRIEHKSGAGGILGSNLVWHAKPDGLTIGLSSGTALMLAQLASGEGVQFDATKFTYLGRPASDDRVIFVRTASDLKSADDLKTIGRTLKVPSQGVDDDFYATAILADAVGFQVQYITGYEGGADTTLAVIKGDGDMRLTSWTSAVPVIKNGDVRPLLSIGQSRNKDYPDTPNALELVADQGKKETLQTLINIQELHRTFFGPPGIDDKIASEMRAAVMEVLKDPAVLEKAKQLDLPIDPMDGAEQQKVVAEIYKQSAAIPEVLKNATASIK